MLPRALRFEDLVAWQKARALRLAIIRAIHTHNFQNDFSLIDQLRRAALSIMSGIAEGFGKDGPKDFHRYLSISRGSTTEVQSHLYAALDSAYIDQAAFDRLYRDADEVLRLVSALRASVARSAEQRAASKRSPENRQPAP